MQISRRACSCITVHNSSTDIAPLRAVPVQRCQIRVCIPLLPRLLHITLQACTTFTPGQKIPEATSCRTVHICLACAGCSTKGSQSTTYRMEPLLVLLHPVPDAASASLSRLASPCTLSAFSDPLYWVQPFLCQQVGHVGQTRLIFC